MKIKSIKEVEKPTFNDVRRWYENNLHPDANDYNDQRVYEHVYHDGRFAGVFQLTSGGAQKLFVAAKPKSIVDIAVLTSIYRPGPLAANVDKLYLNARKGEKYEWGHPLFEKVLGATDNLLIFQESVMDLAEHVGGFPKDQCDNVRRAIMKRDLSKGDAAKAEAKRLEDDFVAGAIKNGVPEVTARKAYQNILWFAGYGFNRAHAVAYAIDSYMCAWLLTHYEEEWLTAYMETMSSNPEDKFKAFGEIRRLGYQIVPIDINHASSGWTILQGKKFMPSFLSCKGIGESAIEEIVANRPYTSIEDMLWNEDGSWRHSKFNRRALESLVKIGGFASLDLVGPGKLFNSHKQMHYVLIENNDLIKKTSKKDPFIGRKNFYELIKQTQDMEEWTHSEKALNFIECMGSADITTVVDSNVLAKLQEKGVKSIDEIEEGKELAWFAIQGATPKKTKNGKNYLALEAIGPMSKPHRIFCWGWDGVRTFSPYSVCLAEVEKNNFGLSTTMFRLKEINLNVKG